MTLLALLLAFIAALVLLVMMKLTDLLRELRELNARVAVVSRVWHRMHFKDEGDGDDYDSIVADELLIPSSSAEHVKIVAG